VSFCGTELANEDIRDIRIRRRAWKNRLNDNWLAKMAKNGKSGHLDSLQNVGVQVGYRHHRKIGIKAGYSLIRR